MISLHLGSFYTAAAFANENPDGQDSVAADAELLTNSDGDRLVRSLLVYTDAGDVLFGASAERASVNPANRLVSNIFKSFINEPKSSESNLNSVMLDYFRTIKTTVDDVAQPTNGISELALTVPVDFYSNATDIHQHLHKLAVESGLISAKGNLHLVPEPVAYINACKPYISASNGNNDSLIILDCGSSHMTCSLVALRSGVPVLVDFEVTNEVSGNAFTNALVDHCLQEFHQKTRFPLQGLKASKKVMHKMRRYAEDAKQNLSNSQNTLVSVESLFEGCDYQSNLNRMRFENLNQCQQLFNKLKSFLQSFVQEHTGTADKIMIVGGASLMPKFGDVVSNAAKNMGIEVISSRNSVVEWPAIGAISELQHKSQLSEAAGDMKSLPSIVEHSRYSLSLIAVDIDGNKKVMPLLKQYQPLPYSATVELQPLLGKTGGYAGIIDDLSGKMVKIFQIDEYDTEATSLWLHVKVDEHVSVDIVDRRRA